MPFITLKPDTNPFYTPASQPLPHSQGKLVDGMVQEMLDQGVIEESYSPWNSLLFLVPVKVGSLCPVIDFRCVNEATVSDHYPLPVLSVLLQFLGRHNKVLLVWISCPGTAKYVWMRRPLRSLSSARPMDTITGYV